MNSLLERLKTEGHQDSTKATYHGVWRKFNEFIIKLDRIPKSWEERTALYCTHLICEVGLKSSTVKSYISGIKCVLKIDGYEWNDDQILFNVLTRSCKLKNDRVKTRLPIQKGFLDMLLFDIQRRYGGSQPYLEALYITAYSLLYYGLMRIGELTESIHTIKAKDVHREKDGNLNKLLLVLYTSKTHGLDSIPQQIKILGRNAIEIFQNSTTTSYKSHRHLIGHFCPVEWAIKYIRYRPPIRHVNEQFLIFNDGTNLQAQHLRQLLRNIITNSFQLDGCLYDTHSFRIGRATDLFRAKIPVDQIKNLGRWKSNAVYKYLR